MQTSKFMFVEALSPENPGELLQVHRTLARAAFFEVNFTLRDGSAGIKCGVP
jgi:hypothetical protein